MVVSVIVPTRNRRAFLQEAIDSVRAQSHASVEIIVVDDASEDDTWSWLERPANADVRRLRMDTNRGSTITRNAGLRIAEGDVCLFLDDDDRLPSGALEAHLSALDAYPEAIATLGSVDRMDADGRPIEGLLRPSPVRRQQHQIWRNVLFWWTFLVGASMFRRPSLESIGGFDESIEFFGDDVDLWLRFGHLGPVVLLPDVTLTYRSHTQTRPDDYLETLNEIRRRFAETCEPERRAAARRILAAQFALGDLRVGSGRPGNLLRNLRLAACVARCPYLLGSPLSMTQITQAVRRDLAMDPWLTPVRRLLGGST
jgi:glycosyltransferase involved in cell wall biosynthesis